MTKTSSNKVLAANLTSTPAASTYITTDRNLYIFLSDNLTFLHTICNFYLYFCPFFFEFYMCSTTSSLKCPVIFQLHCLVLDYRWLNPNHDAGLYYCWMKSAQTRWVLRLTELCLRPGTLHVTVIRLVEENKRSTSDTENTCNICNLLNTRKCSPNNDNIQSSLLHQHDHHLWN